VFLNIDLMHMYEYDRELYNQLIAYPGEVIPLIDTEARYIAEDLIGEELPESKLLTVSSLCSPLLQAAGPIGVYFSGMSRSYLHYYSFAAVHALF